MPEGACDPVLEQASGNTCGPMERGAHAGTVCEELQPWEGLTLDKFMEDCLPWKGPHSETGEECEESSP